jgi:hypothetical protein
MWAIDEENDVHSARAAMERIPAVRDALAEGYLRFGAIRIRGVNFPSTGVTKKMIIDKRKGGKRQ